MMKILIVDDDKTIAGFLSEMIEEEGVYRVATAANGAEGYELSLQFKPDIVITDIQMPMKNGLEMVSEIRNHDPAIRTIYMSGDLDQYRTLLEEEKMKYHANFIEKPFSKFELDGALFESVGRWDAAFATMYQ